MARLYLLFIFGWTAPFRACCFCTRLPSRTLKFAGLLGSNATGVKVDRWELGRLAVSADRIERYVKRLYAFVLRQRIRYQDTSRCHKLVVGDEKSFELGSFQD